MKNISKIFLVVISISGFTSAFADGPGWTGASTITKLVVTANGGINVLLSPKLSGCTSQSGYGPEYASIYPNHAGIQLMQSNLLAAFMGGKKVKLYLSDANCKAMEMIISE